MRHVDLLVRRTLLEPARPSAVTRCGPRAGRLHAYALRTTRPYLKDDYGIPYAYEVFHARCVPVGEANAAVARSAANCLRIIRAVNTDPRFV